MKKCPNCKSKNLTVQHSFETEETIYKCNNCKAKFSKDHKHIHNKRTPNISEDKKLLLTFYRVRRGR